MKAMEGGKAFQTFVKMKGFFSSSFCELPVKKFFFFFKKKAII